MNILFGILNMGLGHATRSLVLIRYLVSKNHYVYVVSTGRSLSILKDELSACPGVYFIDEPDYGILYSRKLPLVIKLGSQIPKLLLGIMRELKKTEEWIKKYEIDIIISDHRYGIRNGAIPSYFMTHQIAFAPPIQSGLFWKISAFLHQIFLKKHSGILVPDIPDHPGMSGRLSHGYNNLYENILFLGGLSSLPQVEGMTNEIDILAIISGPEPLRGLFEAKMTQILSSIPGRHVVVAGRPEAQNINVDNSGVTVYSHVSRQRMAELIQASKFIISRSGYSSLMDFAGLQKVLILVPTPGQTEQEYLAALWENSGMCLTLQQSELNTENVLQIMETSHSVNQFLFQSNTLYSQVLETVLRGQR